MDARPVEKVLAIIGAVSVCLHFLVHLTCKELQQRVDALVIRAKCPRCILEEVSVAGNGFPKLLVLHHHHIGLSPGFFGFCKIFRKFSHTWGGMDGGVIIQAITSRQTDCTLIFFTFPISYFDIFSVRCFGLFPGEICVCWFMCWFTCWFTFVLRYHIIIIITDSYQCTLLVHVLVHVLVHILDVYQSKSKKTLKHSAWTWPWHSHSSAQCSFANHYLSPFDGHASHLCVLFLCDEQQVEEQMHHARILIPVALHHRRGNVYPAATATAITITIARLCRTLGWCAHCYGILIYFANYD